MLTFKLLIAPNGTTKWVEVEPTGEIPRLAVAGGVDYGGNKPPTYLCRAWHNGNLIAGRIPMLLVVL